MSTLKVLTFCWGGLLHLNKERKLCLTKNQARKDLYLTKVKWATINDNFKNSVPIPDSLASPSWLSTAKSLRTRAWSWNTLTTKLYCCPISSRATINASSICQKTSRKRKDIFQITSTFCRRVVEEAHCLSAVLQV